MTPNQMREQLMQVYRGPMWRMKVDTMDDKQVIAMYLEMQREGRLFVHDGSRKQEAEVKKAAECVEMKEPDAYQLSIDDLL